MANRRRHSRGAGGTNGGIGSFILGVLMMCGGGYMLLQSIIVRSNFGWGTSLYHFGGGAGSFSITSGMVFIPFLIGIGIVFYNARNFIGWLLTLGSVTALVFGVISNLHASMKTMSAFDLMVILVLTVGGLGLFLRSLRNLNTKLDDYEEKLSRRRR